LRVVLLEDQPADAELILHALRRAGFEVDPVRVDSEAAYLAELDRAPDLILADYNLPQFDGLTALRRVRERGLEIPFLLISGTIGEEVAVESMKQGADDYLLKDRLARIGPAVERALEQRRLRRDKLAADQALRQSEERFRALIENSADVISLIDATGTILFETPSVERVLGYRPDELVGQSAFSLVHPDDLEAATRAFSRLIEDPRGLVQLVFRFRHKDGSFRDVDATGSNLLANPALGAIVVNFRDVTEKLRAQEGLRLSDEILQRVASLVIVADGQGRVTYASPSVHAILGFQPAEVLGEGWWTLVTSDHGDREEERQRVAAAAKGGAPVDDRPYERSLTARNGETRWIEWRDAKGPGQLLIGVGHDITERKQAEQERNRMLEEISRRAQRLAALRAIDMAITASLDLQLTLQVLLDQVRGQLGVDAASVLLLNPHSQMLEFASGRGFASRSIEELRLRLGEGLAGGAAADRRPVWAPRLDQVEESPARRAWLAQEGFRSYFCVPLISKGQVKGVMEVFQKAPIDPDSDWMDFFESLGGQAAIAIDNAALYQDLERSNLELVLAYDTTIEGWARAADLRAGEPEGHTQQVTDLTVRLGRALGMAEAELVHVRRGSLLHDIGNFAVPEAILLKPGPLTPEEWAQIRRHPIQARELLASIPYLRPSMEIPYSHHERWDGSGYPQKLAGEAIPLSARAFAVVDVWDSLRRDRPHRKAWAESDCVAHLKQNAGVLFDPRAVDALLSELREP
jgi:PAS domain S-box-containing protein